MELCSVHGASWLLDNKLLLDRSRPPRMVLARMAVERQTSTEQARRNGRRALDFVKIHGLGNDFLVIENRDTKEPKVSREDALKLCNRTSGVGGDGVILVLPGTGGCEYSMRLLGADGSELQLHGNGARCMARYLAELEEASAPRSYTIHTSGGTLEPQLREDGQIGIDMGLPHLTGRKIPTVLPINFDGTVIQQPLVVDGKRWLVTCVNLSGTSHCVTFGEEDEQHLFDVDSICLDKLGPLFESHEAFPLGTSVEFVEVVSTTHLKARIWGQGSGPAKACGLGACAVLVAAALEGRVRKKCLVELSGAKAEVEWKASDFRVLMSGPAESVFSGTAFL